MNEKTTPDDADHLKALLKRIASDQDHAAFQSLFRHFAPRIKGFMIKAGSEAHVADDLVQDVFLKVWNKAALYNPEKAGASTWIFTIARNVRIDRLRKQSSRHFDDIDDMELIDDAPASDELLARNQTDKIVGSVIATLPTDQQDAIRLSFVENMSQSEVSEKLDIPLGTVKSRLRLAYQKMRKNLEGVA
ncbi:MAG: sigma-70 family RNA polymerase sigma factor [Stappiaceae bacterium]